MIFFQTITVKDIFKWIYRSYKYTVSLDLGAYWFWAVLRVLLTITPQRGYIHPDEYFQTVEVFAGDAFGTEVSLPWEFNSTFPIRSIPVIYITTHIPFSLLKKITSLTEYYLKINLINHYFLLVVPRLTICLLSFLSDICLFKTCFYFAQNYKERLIIYGSSFVSLIFMTRTFTNTIEIICFNILLCLVASCMAESEKFQFHNDFLQDKYNTASTLPDQVRYSRLLKYLPKHSLKHGFSIAIVVVSGFFNRPTFALFAITPLFYWFQRGLDIKSSFLLDFHLRIFLFLLCCVPVVCLYIYIDSTYYGYVTLGEIFQGTIGWKNFVITPLNFFKYNIDSSNLSKHGLHPRLLHFVINIPLLFNVLGLSGLLVIAKLLYRGSISNWTLLPKSQSITGMMTLSFVVPVLGLSFFPHQEPRFITPCLFPLIFLYSHLVTNFDEDCTTVVPFRKRHPKQKELTGLFKFPLKFIDYVEKATENYDNRYNINGRYLAEIKNRELLKATNIPPSPFQPQTKKREEEKSSQKTDLVKIWFLFNFICVFFFGFVHQGGVYGLTKHFHDKLAIKPRYLTYHLVTSHTYSLPKYLLSMKKNYRSKNTNFTCYELGSENLEMISLKLTTILRVSEAKKKSIKRDYKVFYAFPATLLNDFRQTAKNFTYELENSFYPHFSSEALPRLTPNVVDTPIRFSGVFGLLNHFDSIPLRYIVEFFKQFRLVLIQVKLPQEMKPK